MKTPNWQEARDFVDRIAGSADPQMTFQAFDDKGERYEVAGWKHGRLTDPALRSWLQGKANQGCGIFVTVNETNGSGRRRKNIKRARAAFIDLDGEPLPDAWPIEPDIINETSRGKYHCFWLLNPVRNLNEWSDLQARLAAKYAADPRVFDPPRVVRLPGFYHQKSDQPFRSRTLKKVSLDDARFERHEINDLADANPADYISPAARAEEGRSEEPENGWDSPADVDRARAFLASVTPPKTGDRNNQGYRVAAVLNDLGISPELSVDLMEEVWNPRLSNPLKTHEIQHVVKSAGRYKAGSAGSHSLATEVSADFDDLEISEEAFEDKREFDFEGDAPEPDFEGGDPEPDFEAKDAPDSPAKSTRPAKTIKRMTDGVSWSYGHEIRAVPLSWVWPNRIPRGKVTLIAGFPDQGKSQILLKIAALITTGGEWPNGEGTAPKGFAIILSSEDEDDDTLIPRLFAAGADISKIVIVRPMVKYIQDGKKSRRVLNIEDDLQKIDNIIKDVRRDHGEEVRFIGLDPINAYFGGARKADSHKNSDMRALLTPLAEWAARLKVALVAISHFNKGSNSHTLYRITDSTAITAAARSVYVALKKKSDDKNADPERLFVSIKRNLAPESLKGISYTIETAPVEEVTGKAGQEMPFIKFGALDDTPPDEALNGLEDRGRPAQAEERAKAWLVEYFETIAKKSVIDSDEITEAGRKNGHGYQTLCRAAEAIGIVKRKAKGNFESGWEWVMYGGEFDDPPDDA